MLHKVQDIIKINDSFSLARTVEAIHKNLDSNAMGSAIGQCKNLLESLSKSILDKKAVLYSSDIKFPRLVKDAVKALDVGGVGKDDQKTKEAFLKIASSIANSIDNTAEALATLRNAYSKDGHGRPESFVDIPPEYAKLVIFQTDAVVSFLLEISKRHDEFEPDLVFSKNEDYNNFLYEQFGALEIFGDLYQAPEILFHQHPKKYREQLKEYNVHRDEDHDE